MGGGDAVAFEGFPEEGVGLVGVRHLHAVDLDEVEVVEGVGEDGVVELGDDGADGGGLAGAGRAGDVDAGSRAVGDGVVEVLVHGGEFFFAAG